MNDTMNDSNGHKPDDFPDLATSDGVDNNAIDDLDEGVQMRPRKALVAIVGRPNVGKSTLFNRLVGRRRAIVHDAPGVTRDRHYVDAFAFGKTFTVVDTGGFDPDSDDPMRQGIARQVQVAIEQADVIVCVFDALHGATDGDRAAVALLRRSGRQVIYVANKADSGRAALEANDFYSLGVDHVFPVSALHGRGFGELAEAIVSHLPTHELEPIGDRDMIRVAVVGRPNAGKSSLVNYLAGHARSLVDERPGTTRDPVDTMVRRRDKKFLLVDTAGIRRKAKVVKERDVVEVVSVLRALRVMEQADVVVLMCDASIGVAEQDAKILGLAADRGCGLVVALNKVDQLSREQLKEAHKKAKEKLTFASWAPYVFTSALTGQGTDQLMKAVVRVNDNLHRRVGTAQLNCFFEEVLETHPPPTQGGKAPRLNYITQAETSPPLFVIMANAPDDVHFSYQRYVKNQLRARFDFEGVPLKVAYRAKRRSEKRR